MNVGGSWHEKKTFLVQKCSAYPFELLLTRKRAAGNWLLFIILLGGVKTSAMNVVVRRPLAEDDYQFVSDLMKTQYMEDCGRLHSEASSLSVFLMTYRLIICWYTILIMMRFFQAQWGGLKVGGGCIQPNVS